MHSRFLSLGSVWCKWLFRLALISFVGLYSLGLLPHHADSTPDDLKCPICQAVAGLTNLTGHSSPPGLKLVSCVLQILLVLSWAVVTVARTDKVLLLKQSRAPPPVS